MRLVFAGTPEPALPSLRKLIDSPRHEVVAVLTRPDAAAGRRGTPAPSPVAQLAAEHDIPVLKPAKPNSGEFVSELAEFAPEACAVVAYGALLRDELLAVPTHGWINLHFSLLPAWRGAAPVQHAILHGDDVTGATTFRLVAELDAGPVYGVVTEPVHPDDTSGHLLERLAASGAELLVATLDGIEEGTLRAVPQPGEGVSLAPKLTPADARVDWKLPAHLTGRLIRACTPEPGAWTDFEGERVKLWPVTLEPDGAPAALASGELHIERGAVYAGTGSHPVRLSDVQPPGKRRMPAADWARGLRGGQATRPGFG